MIEPADGEWELTPLKIWVTKEDSTGIPAQRKPFTAFNIDMH
jgi:hypothetical protein